ncbi:MAG TPA: glycosyltransferase family 87 protein [Acidobacteriaceae bacterium]|nr:glycosyltransferase family 87 protein [Acidobacteriaceae bacterium]
MTSEAEAQIDTAQTERPRPGVWLTWAAASAVLLGAAFVYLPSFGEHAQYGYKVLGSFWASGWAAAHGLNPYAVYPLTWTFQLNGHPGTVVDLNLSPPALLPFFEAFASVSVDATVRIWTFLSALLMIGAAAMLVGANRAHVQHRQILWFLLARAVFNTLWLGQDYALMIVLAVAGWALLERNRDLSAGIALGVLVAAKPNYALWPLLLVFCGRWKASAVAAGVAAALCALPLALYGPEIYREWVRAVASDPHWFFPNEVSIIGFATRAGHARVGEVLAAALLAAAIVVVAWKRPSLRVTSGVALSVGMLASPLAWYQYAMLMAGPLFARKWNWALTVVLLILLQPWAPAFFLPVWVVTGWFLWEAASQQRVGRKTRLARNA